MKKSYLYAFGGILILGFAGFALANFKQTLTPYVSYEYARSADRVVQVAGGLVHGSSSYDSDAHSLSFEISDKESGETMRVSYEGVKPGNFEDAISVVAIGRYQAQDGVFHADKLLVKCPSKYQGLEDDTVEKTYG